MKERNGIAPHPPIYAVGAVLYFLGEGPVTVLEVHGEQSNGMRYERTYRVRRMIQGHPDEFSAWESDLKPQRNHT